MGARFDTGSGAESTSAIPPSRSLHSDCGKLALSSVAVESDADTSKLPSQDTSIIGIPHCRAFSALGPCLDRHNKCVVFFEKVGA
jgi:hypothetical protein